MSTDVKLGLNESLCTKRTVHCLSFLFVLRTQNTLTLEMLAIYVYQDIYGLRR
jgi:hypothetical protein